MKTALLIAMTFGSRLVFGGIYVWTGAGETGNWNDVSNWKDTDGNAVSAAPNAGDVVEFSSNAEITGDLVLDAGDLVITNAASTALHFKGVISGEGGIVKGGDGELHLHSSNTFTGGLVSCGTGGYGANTSSTASSCVYAYASDALGAGTARFDPEELIGTSSGHGARLYLRADYATELEFSHPVVLSGDQDSKGNLHIDGKCTLVTFKEQVVSPWRVQTSISSGKPTIVFEKGYSAVNYNIFNNCILHFKGSINSTVFLYSSNTETHLYSTENEYYLFRVAGPVYLHAENVLRSDGGYYDFSSASGVIDLNGFDQTVSAMSKTFVQSTKTGTFGFTSPLDKSAVLRLDDAVPSHFDFHGLFSGSAGLVWAPEDVSKEFCFSNTVQTTCGDFTVASGIMRFRDSAGFDRLGSLTVKSGAKLIAESTAGELNVESLTLEEGAVLELAEGVVLQCRDLTVGENVYEDYGYYGNAEMPGVITGPGRVLRSRASNVWTGGDGDWNVPANWSLGKVPEKDESVSVNGEHRIVVSETTPRLFALNLAGGTTLVFSNGWDVCVQADNIRIYGSTVTLAGHFTNETDKCRVHFKCGSFFLDSDSAIDVDGKGWRGGGYIPEAGVSNPTKIYVNAHGVVRGGFGPGCANVTAGASHFGYGAFIANKTGVYDSKTSPVYDDPYAPTEPGSGGFGLGGTAYGCVHDPLSVPSGGGAVFIEATGAVELNGKITACGIGAYINHAYYCNSPNNSNTGGSGGAVRIVCETVSGSGEILADGGNGGFSIPYPRYNAGGKYNYGSAGGGGGIAIVYDAEKQLPGAVRGMKISAAAGYYPEMPKLTEGNTEFLPYAKMDKYRRDAEPGTLYFSDRKIVDDTIGKGLNGKLFDVESYVYDGDLHWSYGNVRFGATGAVFAVNGDLTVTGGWSRIDIGGITKITNFGTRPYIHSGTVCVKLEVAGDLVVSNGAALAVYAAEVPDETVFGARVSVAGVFEVGDGGTVLPTSDYGNGGAPEFSAGAFRLHENGRVDADHRGYSGAWNSYHYPVRQAKGRGPGGGDGKGAGAGHGGEGACGILDGASQGGGKGGVYSNAYLPVRSGSGGGGNGNTWSGDGGGVFYLATTGTVELAGTISADGSFQEYSNDDTHTGGSGSGGSVCIIGATVTAAESARISARGGDAPMLRNANTSPGAGGGGRVSVWTGGDLVAAAAKPRRLHSLDPAADIFDGTLVWSGAVDVSGGTNVFSIGGAVFDQLPQCHGSAGTVWFNRAVPQSLSIILR